MSEEADSEWRKSRDRKVEVEKESSSAAEQPRDWHLGFGHKEECDQFEIV